MKINSKYRWILLVPTVLSMTFLVWILLILASRISFPPTKTEMYFWFILGGTFMGITWILTCFFMAPSHKKKTVWVAYIVGVLFVIIISFPSIKAFINHNYINVWLSASIAAICSGPIAVFIINLKLSK